MQWYADAPCARTGNQTLKTPCRDAPWTYHVLDGIAIVTGQIFAVEKVLMQYNIDVWVSFNQVETRRLRHHRVDLLEETVHTKKAKIKTGLLLKLRFEIYIHR